MNALHFVKKLIPAKIFKKLQPAYHLTLAWLSALWYKFPSEKLIVIGVTGTTGKTTVIYLIAKVLEEAGFSVGVTSTALFKVGKEGWNNDKKMTMPGRFFTQKMLARMVRAGCQYAIIETTSEGIEQFRHRFINYDICIFTGIYAEHIDAHGSFANYKAAKLKLFAHLATGKLKYVNEERVVQTIKNELKKIHCARVQKTIIVNGDDTHAPEFLNFNVDQKIKYQVSSIQYKDEDSNYRVKEVASSSNGIRFKIDDEEFQLQLMGAFNVSNALVAIALGLSQELSLKIIKKGLEKINGVPGRFERIDEGQKFRVIVDYAFEPNAVTKLYETVESLTHGKKIVHVLGATGGGRDVGRRPILGRIAGERADIVVVTNEDPYDDVPEIIMDQVAVGVEKAGKILGENLFKILDRRAAIAKAFSLARAGDIVLITGKGNEQAICVADGKKIPWDDRTVAREEIRKVGSMR
jgi:UDP-N-acetylmuramoyl-L-alanyl-D-glutamate--2,6-diaminopimelate ligase